MKPAKVGVSVLRNFTRKSLKSLDEFLIICSKEEELAVLVPYDTYLRIQSALVATGKLEE
jgi:hypothetical protein